MTKYQNPREEIHSLIEKEQINSLLLQAAKLHGHVCPFLTLGVRSGVRAAKTLDIVNKGMENIIAIVETNNCFSDGIQYVTGCTFGNNSLIYRDYGKTAFTLLRRGTEGLRISVRPEFREYMNESFPEYSKLFDKVVAERDGDQKDYAKLMEHSSRVSQGIIDIPFDEIFKIEKSHPEIPDYAPILESRQCEKCGENVMASRIVEKDNEVLCIPCSGEEYSELNGEGITTKK